VTGHQSVKGTQRILMKLCVCYVISAELIEGREWMPSVCSQSKEPILNHSHSVLSTDCTQTVSTPYLHLIRHLWCNIRTISSGSFGLPEDGAHTAPKHVGATLIFEVYGLRYFEYAFRWFYFIVQTKYQKISTVFWHCECVMFVLCRLMLYGFQKCGPLYFKINQVILYKCAWMQHLYFTAFICSNILWQLVHSETHCNVISHT
jgi:hypothetical protein